MLFFVIFVLVVFAGATLFIDRFLLAAEQLVDHAHKDEEDGDAADDDDGQDLDGERQNVALGQRRFGGGGRRSRALWRRSFR